jgi:hypothetical protein
MQLLVRLPHSHIDPNWLSAVERESRTQPRESRTGSNHILSATGSLPISRLVFTNPIHLAVKPATHHLIKGRVTADTGFATAERSQNTG